MDVLEASDGEEALKIIDEHKPTGIVLDIMMPNKTGLEVIDELSLRGIRTPIVIVSAFVTMKEFISLKHSNKNVKSLLSKPFTHKEFVAVLNDLLKPVSST